MNILFILFYGFLSLSFLFVLFKHKLKTLYYLPMFWMIAEMLSTYFYEFDSGGTINAITFIYICFASFKIGPKVFLQNIFIIIFLFIAFIKTPFDINYLSFGNRYLNLFNIYLILPISFYIIKDFNEFRIINNVLYKTLFVTLIYVLFSSALKAGPNMYNTGIIYGLNWGQFYGPALIAILLLIFPFADKQLKFTKVICIFFIFITVLTFRRTAILIITIFSLVYFIQTLEIKKIGYLLVILFALSLFYFGLENISGVKNSSRTIVLSEDYDITTEGRYYDIFGVYMILKMDNALLLGHELFNDYGNYGSKRATRPIHVDIMRFFYGVGFLGLVPLIIGIGLNTIKFINYKQNRNIRSIGISLITIFIMTLFTGGTLYISYSGLIFIYLGGLLSLLKGNNNKNAKNSFSYTITK